MSETDFSPSWKMCLRCQHNFKMTESDGGDCPECGSDWLKDLSNDESD